MLSISEVRERTGLRASALRYYEEVGLLTPAGRVSGRRHYDESVLDRLRVIVHARRAGFSIAEIRQLLQSGPSSWQEVARRKLAEVEDTIADAQAKRDVLKTSLNCDCTDLECCEVLAACSEPTAG